MADQAQDFGRRLSLAIKILNISRGALAAEAKADKSLVSRWARGVTFPRGHYLHVLTRIVAERAPGFTQLHWEGSLEEFQRVIGAKQATTAGTAESEPVADARGPTTGDWLPLAAVQSQTETARDGDRYPGVYIQVRHRFSNDRPYAECIPIWREGDQLRVRFDGPFWAHTGRIFILGHQLFMVAEDRAVAEGLWVQIMNGVASGKAKAMDGVLCTVPHDRSRAPGATLTLMFRIADLDDPFQEPPAAKMKAYQQKVFDLMEADEVAKLSGPEIIRHVSNRIHQPREDGAVDHFLTAPASRGFTIAADRRHAAIETAIVRWRRALGVE